MSVLLANIRPHKIIHKLFKLPGFLLLKWWVGIYHLIVTQLVYLYAAIVAVFTYIATIMIQMPQCLAG